MTVDIAALFSIVYFETVSQQSRNKTAELSIQVWTYLSKCKLIGAFLQHFVVNVPKNWLEPFSVIDDSTDIVLLRNASMHMYAVISSSQSFK
jgi:hypothetical protein